MATTSVQSASSQVRVRLRTNNEDIQLPADIGAILISTDVRRYQLSTLVNRLLKTERPIPLEFLINGQFLRTSLDEFLTQNGISAETTLNVEYVRALVPPVPVASFPHDDWISSLDVLSTTSRAVTWQSTELDDTRQSRILSGSFDGNLRVWNSSSDVIAIGVAHTGPVKDVKFITPGKIVSAGMDRTVRIWDFDDASEPSQSAALVPSLELYGHTASVNHLAVHGPSSRILSASDDYTVGIWSTNKSSLPPAPESLISSSSTSNKRRKVSHSSKISQRGPTSLMTSHKAEVSAVCFDTKDSTVAYSASWDHSVKTWDLTTTSCVDTRTTSQSLYSLAHLPDLSLLAAGTSARHVTLIDPRASATTISAMTLKGHTNSISSIAQDPATTYQIVSGSHDGTCRIWDLRSVRSDIDGKTAEAVYVIERESVRGQVKRVAGDGIKVFDVVWDAEVGIASAGEDKVVQINKST